MKTFDVIIVGAGPAGLGAARRAQSLSLTVLLLDEQSNPGGQIYRNVTRAPPNVTEALGRDYTKGRFLIAELDWSAIEHVDRASVWFLDSEGVVTWSRDGQSSQARGRRVILATGAMERPFPIPGWTLPGVMSAGAAQVALKTAGAVAEGAVFAGTGPLLLLVAAQYCRLGVPIRAIVETTPPLNYLRACVRLPSALRDTGLLRKGFLLRQEIRTAGIAVYQATHGLTACGDHSLKSIAFRNRWGWRRLDGVEHLFLHQGVVPNIQLAVAAGCRRVWDESQLAWVVDTDDDGRTSLAKIFVAGDAGRIIGADAAHTAGELVALVAACELGAMTPCAAAVESRPLRRRLVANERSRKFVDALFRPSTRYRSPCDPDTILCRCEDVTVAMAQAAFAESGLDLNRFKSASRCAMGPCQGRMCALTLRELMGVTATAQESIVAARLRPPVQPVRLQEIANLDEHTRGR